MAIEVVAANIDMGQKREVSNVRRDGATKTHVGEVQGGDTVVAGSARDTNPLAN